MQAFSDKRLTSIQYEVVSLVTWARGIEGNGVDIAPGTNYACITIQSEQPF